MDWSKFEPTDFETDELFAHQITFKEAVECFYNDFQIRRNKSLDEFLENFLTVKREQSVRVLEYFKSTLDDIKKAA